MFKEQAFNQDINWWFINVVYGSHVPKATAFNQDISAWDTSLVINTVTCFKKQQHFQIYLHGIPVRC